MYWLLYPIICSVLWGVSYTLLRPVSAEIQKYTINSIYGLSMFIINMVALAITNQYSDFLLINNLKVILCLTFYVILSVAAGILFLVGYNIEGINSGVYTLISSTYPVLTLILSYIFLDQRNINPYFASFGTILTIVGVSLLALSKNS